MLYNLIQYLENELPGEIFYNNAMRKIAGQDFVPDRFSIIRETSGTLTPWFQLARKTFQVITKDIDEPKAREFAYSIFDKINNKFGLELPSVIVGSITYNAVKTAQISAIQEPYYLGMDDQGRNEYTTNYYILNKE